MPSRSSPHFLATKFTLSQTMYLYLVVFLTHGRVAASTISGAGVRAEAQDSSLSPDLSTAEASSVDPLPDDCADKLESVQDELNKFKDLYAKEKENNEYLSEKMARQSSRHNDIVLALSWNYDQLERKAQSYYNSFQTQKNRATSVTTKGNELHGAGKNIIPFLLSRSKQRQQMAREAQEKANRLQAEREAGLQKQQQLEYDPEAPQARAAGPPSAARYNPTYLAKKASNRPGAGFMLKSAMGPSASSPSRAQTGRIPDFDLGWKGKKRKILMTKHNNVKSKGINKNNADSLFAQVDFRQDFQRAKKYGGIKR